MNEELKVRVKNLAHVKTSMHIPGIFIVLLFDQVVPFKWLNPILSIVLSIFNILFDKLLLFKWLNPIPQDRHSFSITSLQTLSRLYQDQVERHSAFRTKKLSPTEFRILRVGTQSAK